MEVEELMSTEPECCRPEDPLDRVVRQMRQRDCGFLPVIDDEGLAIGVITDRDIALAAADEPSPLADLTVSTAMSANELLSCSPEDDIADVEATMRRAQVRRLPVLDEGGVVIGVISLNDIALAQAAEDAEPRGAVDVARTLAGISQHRGFVM